MADPEKWRLRHAGACHEVEVADAGFRRSITWRVDGVEVATRTTGDDKVVLDGAATNDRPTDHGAVALRLPSFGGPARRVTWWPPDDERPAVLTAHLGTGGVDLDPEPGSKAAVREAWIREHPHRYAVRRGATAVATIAVPVLLVWLLGRFALPAIPWPDWDLSLPRIPWPDIPWPRIPWPDVAWPDLPEWSLPGWLRRLLDLAQLVWPVLLALALARAEVRRRRVQDERKSSASPAIATAPTSSAAPAEGGDRRGEE